MNYEDFVGTELFYDLTNTHYEPDFGIVYGKVDNAFTYRSEYYSRDNQIAYHLDTGVMRKV